MELKVGDKVSVLDTELLRGYIRVGDVGVVTDLGGLGGTCLKVQFPQYDCEQYIYTYQVQPVSEVIKVNCHKPNVLQRIWNYLRGIK